MYLWALYIMNENSHTQWWYHDDDIVTLGNERTNSSVFSPGQFHQNVRQNAYWLAQQTRDFEPMLGWFWANIADDGPALTHNWLNISCVLYEASLDLATDLRFLIHVHRSTG